MQTSETFVRTYSIEELNARYPHKPWLEPFDIDVYDFTPKVKGKKSKLTNGFMLNPFGNHPLEDCFEEKPIIPTSKKTHQPIKKEKTIIKKKKVIIMSEQKTDKQKKEKTPEELEAIRLRKKAWDDANRERVNARRRELDRIRRIKRSQEKAAITLLGKKALLERTEMLSTANPKKNDTTQIDIDSLNKAKKAPLPFEKENSVNTLKHVIYLIQYTSNALTNDEDCRKNINKYHKLLESMAISLNMVKENIENGS